MKTYNNKKDRQIRSFNVRELVTPVIENGKYTLEIADKYFKNRVYTDKNDRSMTNFFKIQFDKLTQLINELEDKTSILKNDHDVIATVYFLGFYNDCLNIDAVICTLAKFFEIELTKPFTLPNKLNITIPFLELELD